MLSSSVFLFFHLSACQVPRAAVESGEWKPGGDTTNVLLLGSNSFLRPAANLTDENELLFYSAGMERVSKYRRCEVALIKHWTLDWKGQTGFR